MIIGKTRTNQPVESVEGFSGGTQLYKHTIRKTDYSTIGQNTFNVISNSDTLFSGNNFISGFSVHNGPVAEGSNKNGIIYNVTGTDLFTISVLDDNGISNYSVQIGDENYSDEVTPL